MIIFRLTNVKIYIELCFLAFKKKNCDINYVFKKFYLPTKNITFAVILLLKKIITNEH